MSDSTVTIIATGGTIDKIYFDAKSDYQIGEPEIGRILRQMNVTFHYEIKSLMRKDSIEIDAADRALIHQTIDRTAASRVVVTHGTDSMVETARTLLDIEDRTIVLTGALNPARFVGSDAIFNVGCAIGAVQSLPHGVYIAMNGRIWDPERVRKNRAANRFEAVD